jgi:hypothetical protein
MTVSIERSSWLAKEHKNQSAEALTKLDFDRFFLAVESAHDDSACFCEVRSWGAGVGRCCASVLGGSRSSGGEAGSWDRPPLSIARTD